MARVLFTGWNYGLRKISLIKLFQKKANLSLGAAKNKTDILLDGAKFIIEVESVEDAEEFVKEATVIGAVCEIINDDD